MASPLLLLILLQFLYSGPCITQGYRSVEYQDFVDRINRIDTKITEPLELVNFTRCGTFQIGFHRIREMYVKFFTKR